MHGFMTDYHHPYIYMHAALNEHTIETIIQRVQDDRLYWDIVHELEGQGCTGWNACTAVIRHLLCDPTFPTTPRDQPIPVLSSPPPLLPKKNKKNKEEEGEEEEHSDVVCLEDNMRVPTSCTDPLTFFELPLWRGDQEHTRWEDKLKKHLAEM